MKNRKRIFVGFAAFLFVAGYALGQESSSKPADASTFVPPKVPVEQSGPTSTLKDVLSAACSQNQVDFARFLTERNKAAFSRMTPAARIALMKRFVLLNQPGKATVSTNPSGRPIVRCQTPDVTTEMQIGGAEIHDNVALLPMELRDTTDSAGASVRQINMGLVREDGEWKLLSLGVLLLDLPALEVEWDESEIQETEKDALESLKTIASAIESYRDKYLHLPESLASLAAPAQGAPKMEAAGLLDADLAKGVKNGYAFRYVIVGASTVGAPAKYELSATPIRYGRTGRRSFFRDSNGGLHAADRQGAIGSEGDPRAE